MSLRVLAVILALLAVVLGPHAVLVFIFVLAVTAAGALAALIGRRILADLNPVEAFP